MHWTTASDHLNPSGQYIYHYVLILKCSTFCPYNALMSFVMPTKKWDYFLARNQQAGLNNQYGARLLRGTSSNIVQFKFSLQTAQAISLRPLTAEARVPYQFCPCNICGEQSDHQTNFCPSISLVPCQHHLTRAPYASSSTCYIYQNARGSTPGFKTAMLSRKSRSNG